MHRNLSVAALYEHALRNGEGALGADGQLVVDTGAHTARSPGDKFVVREPSTGTLVDWGESNRPIDAAAFDALLERARAYLSGRDTYVVDAYAGAGPGDRVTLRLTTDLAWHALFARNLFSARDLRFGDGLEPDLTVVDAAGFEADPARDGTSSGTFVLLDLGRRIVLIGGTRFAGELKKSIFTVLNYLLPLRGVLPMHCAANVGPAGETALFFGSSGAGKTTLSANAGRHLLGDDEHAWSSCGVANLEAGCYAGVAELSRASAAEIWDASHRFGAVLENVVYDPHSRELDPADTSRTDNARASYSVREIPGSLPGALTDHPRAVVFLVPDAFGVLPPVARLTHSQAVDHFLYGYAGEFDSGGAPVATFSACFGAAFLVHRPERYAKLFAERIAEHRVECWLVNTGWGGEPRGAGRRTPIEFTRRLIAAALDGEFAVCEYEIDPFFGLARPRGTPCMPGELLDPRATWPDAAAYAAQATILATLLRERGAALATVPLLQ